MCGISGIINYENKSCIYDLIESLFHLQHRGQDSCGIHTSDGKRLYIIKGQGLITNIFDVNNINRLKGNIGIGHVRYPTSGELTSNEIQPFYINRPFKISLCHNGNIYNFEELKIYLKNNNIHINSKSDSDLLLNLISFELEKNILKGLSFKQSIIETIRNISKKCRGAYSVILFIKDYGLISFRDPYGIRPLIYSKNKDKLIITSESISIQNLGLGNIEYIKNGEILFADILDKSISKFTYDNSKLYTPCIFEYVYISRAESIVDGVSVYQSRENMGKYLAKKIQKTYTQNQLDKIDYVVPIPDTSRPTAIVISKILSIPYYEVIIKNRYVSRTFIMNTQENRCSNIRRKFGIVKNLIKNKNILLIDDSIVRGNTIKHIIKLLKDNGANSLFLALSCPIIKYSNFYGIDIPDDKKLIGSKLSEEEMEKELGIEKITFQNYNDLVKSVSDINPKLTRFESSIFDGKYII